MDNRCEHLSVTTTLVMREFEEGESLNPFEPTPMRELVSCNDCPYQFLRDVYDIGIVSG